MPRKSPKQPEALSAVVILRFARDGRWTVNWIDCDIHDAIPALEQALEGVRATHRQEHEDKGDWAEAHGGALQ